MGREGTPSASVAPRGRRICTPSGGGNQGDNLIRKKKRADGKEDQTGTRQKQKRNQKETDATINLPDDDEVTIAGDEGREY